VIPHLILDEQSVDTSSGVRFHLNQATKYPDNPVLDPGRPEEWDSLQIYWPGTVLYDGRERIFRCWYTGMDATQSSPRKWHFGYAESHDGVDWRKPDLGQVQHRGRGTNRLGGPGLEHVLRVSAVVEDPNPPSVSERFVALTIDEVDGAKDTWRKRLAYSPDGIIWDWNGPTAWEPYYPPDHIVYDISQLLVDPTEADPDLRVKAYSQAQFWGDDVDAPPTKPSVWDPSHRFVRCIGFLGGSTFETLTEREHSLALAPDPSLDDELHMAGVQRVGDVYVMLFESDRFRSDPLHGDLRLAVSSDGMRFRRIHPTSSVVPTGGRGTWDENIIVTTSAGMVHFGDEVRIYYFGCSRVFRAWPVEYSVTPKLRASFYYPASIGLATLPRDRYAFATGPGTLTTHPIVISDGGLWLNAHGDGFTVTVIGGGPDGNDIVGRLTNERLQTVYRRVAFDMDPVPGSHHLRVELPAAGRLYSIQS
jgi:hypothetical protein